MFLTDKKFEMKYNNSFNNSLEFSDKETHKLTSSWVGCDDCCKKKIKKRNISLHKRVKQFFEENGDNNIDERTLSNNNYIEEDQKSNNLFILQTITNNLTQIMERTVNKKCIAVSEKDLSFVNLNFVKNETFKRIVMTECVGIQLYHFSRDNNQELERDLIGMALRFGKTINFCFSSVVDE
ncbi:hypothetical protein ABK040_006031 [Willaertia magna]